MSPAVVDHVSSFESGFQLDSIAYAYIVDHMHA